MKNFVNNQKEILSQFIGKNEFNETNSIVVMQTYLADQNSGSFKKVANFVTTEAIAKIKLLNDNIMVDLFFENKEVKDYETLNLNIDIYKVLCENKDVAVFNVITLVCNDNEKNKQINFANPKFFDKCSNKSGRPTNGIRLLYDYDNVMYDENTDKEMYEEDEVNNDDKKIQI